MGKGTGTGRAQAELNRVHTTSHTPFLGRRKGEGEGRERKLPFLSTYIRIYLSSITTYNFTLTHSLFWMPRTRDGFLRLSKPQRPNIIHARLLVIYDNVFAFLGGYMHVGFRTLLQCKQVSKPRPPAALYALSPIFRAPYMRTCSMTDCCGLLSDYKK